MKTLILFASLMFGMMPNSIDAVNHYVHNHHVEHAQQNGTTVYVTRTGTKFHKKTCFHIEGRQTFSMSRSTAVSNGYSACKHCKP